jgi:hypothetical protein
MIRLIAGVWVVVAGCIVTGLGSVLEGDARIGIVSTTGLGLIVAGVAVTL